MLLERTGFSNFELFVSLLKEGPVGRTDLDSVFFGCPGGDVRNTRFAVDSTTLGFFLAFSKIGFA